MLKQRSQLSNIAHIVQFEYFFDQLVALFSAKYRRHQIARFRQYLVSAHRIFRRTTHGVVFFAKPRSVLERNLDNCDAPRQQALQFLLGRYRHLGAFALDRGIYHACLVVRCLEGDGSIEQMPRKLIRTV